MTVWGDAHFLWSGSVGDLLDSSKTTVEKRTITLPLAGETGLAIIRHQAGAEYTMAALEQAVRHIEHFMGYPFPARQVVVWMPAWEPSLITANFGGLFIRMPLAKTEATAELHLRYVIAHEVAHYYWSIGDTIWSVEGAAEFMASLLDGTASDPVPAPTCGYDNIADWEAQYPPTPQLPNAEPCDYELGEALFRDLYQNMDEVQFRLAFRRLLLRMQWFRVPLDVCGLTVEDRTDMCNLRESFTAFVSPEDKPRIEAIIDRWHYGEKS